MLIKELIRLQIDWISPQFKWDEIEVVNELSYY